MRRRGVLVLGLAGALLAAGLAVPARADHYNDPLLVNWPALLPAAPTGPYEPDGNASTEGTVAEGRTRADADCARGTVGCVDNVIDEMTERWEARQCDRNGVFALTYLITTIQYLDAVTTAEFFTDTDFLNHYDAVFADYYFEAYDDWTQDRRSEVPEAWRIAFEAADGDTVTGYGDMVLGMNAHIVRDLPFVIERIGLVDGQGTSRHPDHSKVNVFLTEAGKIVPERVARVFDPTINANDVPGTDADSTTLLQLIVEWREQAWREAEMLTAAQGDPERHDQIAKMIEDDAAMRARGFVEQYRATTEQNDTRETYCANVYNGGASHRGDDDLLKPYTGTSPH